MPVGLIYDDRMCGHEDPNSKKHPECPARITSILQAVSNAGLLNKCVQLNGRKATVEELKVVHSENHVKNICCLSHMPYMKSTNNVLSSRYERNSIYFNDKSFEAATVAAGSVVELSVKVAKGEFYSGAAIVRPPGHHACPNVAMGFCFFNNVAVAARILSGGLVGSQQVTESPKKVLIVDWDVHHGNGTQLMFFKDPNVLYFSVHRYDGGKFYPGRHEDDTDREDPEGEDGNFDKVGKGAGEGFNVNVPWPSGGFGDADYVAVWEHVLMPIAEAFRPDIVLISAGFDAAAGDDLGGCEVTPEGYKWMTRMLQSLAGGRVVLVLEGGYNLEATSLSFVACLQALTDDRVDKPVGVNPSDAAWDVIFKVRQVHSKYWPSLKPVEQLYVDLPIRRPPREWVWYATYGSNMWPVRLNCYIQGGKVEGAQKSTPGLSDRTPPRDNIWLTFPHRLFFGRKYSNTWGPGGVAFLNPMESADTAYFRAYKITYEQLNGIFAQENSLDPARQGGPVCDPDIIRVLREVAPHYIEFMTDTNMWYRLLLYLGEYDKLPVLTLTCPPSDVEKYISGDLPVCEPSESYRNTIAKGLRDHPGLNAASINRYLEKAIGREPFKPPPPPVLGLPLPPTQPSPAALFQAPIPLTPLRQSGQPVQASQQQAKTDHEALTHRKRKNTLRRHS